ncbi:MAG: low molecular weight phosphotyrosine protein phosphatase [Alphaproteobacteria bacterium]|nr:low molecular weight phosphotyrosine protein phosphatase [Alphaproteobacteria bacterium]
MIRVLFVCLGNICRSPTAEGVFRDLVAREGLAHAIGTDSAGTAAYHIGNPPDPRTVAAARRRGVDLSDLRARKVAPGDFGRFHYVLAMDGSNYDDLLRVAPREGRDRLRLFLDFAPELGVKEVPDPYYGGADGFEHVLDLVDAASQGLLAHIRATHLNSPDGRP